MPTSDLAIEPDETRDCASATDDRNTRHPAAVSRAAARTAPSPSFHFLLDERKAARAASKSDVEVDGGLRVQARAPCPRFRPDGASDASIEAARRGREPRARAAPHLQRATCTSTPPEYSDVDAPKCGKIWLVGSVAFFHYVLMPSRIVSAEASWLWQSSWEVGRSVGRL